MARNDIYTRVSIASRVPREDVKRVLHAAGYAGMEEGVTFEGNNGGSYIKLQERREGVLYLEVGETCVVTVKMEIGTPALCCILTHAKDLGFQKLLDDYMRTPNGSPVFKLEGGIDDSER
jgi:hypothetical protein